VLRQKIIEIPSLLSYCQTNLIFVRQMENSMAKTLVSDSRIQRAKRLTGSPQKNAPGKRTDIQLGQQNEQAPISKARFAAVMLAAEQSGLLREKGSRIGGRVSAALVKQAKRLTGIQTDTDLIEFALATVALEDKFAETFKESRGKVDRDLKLGF
jgi:hypothetical protein